MLILKKPFLSVTVPEMILSLALTNETEQNSRYSLLEESLTWPVNSIVFCEKVSVNKNIKNRKEKNSLIINNL